MLIFFWSTFPILCHLFIACSKAHSYSPAQWKQAYSIKYSCVLKLPSFVSCIVSTQNHDHSIKACHSMSYCQLIKWGGLLHTFCCSLCNLWGCVPDISYNNTILYWNHCNYTYILKPLHEVMRRLHGTLWCDYVHKAIIAWRITACMVVMWRSVK